MIQGFGMAELQVLKFYTDKHGNSDVGVKRRERHARLKARGVHRYKKLGEPWPSKIHEWLEAKPEELQATKVRYHDPRMRHQPGSQKNK